MRIYAHRGDHRSVPENTMASFLAAEMARADGIETDLRHTRDGVIALFHDHAVDGVPVSELSHRQLVERTGISVPTLDDVAARTWRCAWNLEIKTAEAYALSRRAMAGWNGQLLISSFLHDVVARAARETGQACGALVAHRPMDGEPPQRIPGVGTLVWDWKVVDEGAIARAADAGWINAAYGAASRDEHETARRWGVATMITDHLVNGSP